MSLFLLSMGIFMFDWKSLVKYQKRDKTTLDSVVLFLELSIVFSTVN